jgi:U3 small nucleolar RNA-associated protein 22
VAVTGDFAAETMALPEAVVDVTLTLPASCFYHKDHLNHQYHAKRALYLLTVASALRKTANFKQQRWEYIHNNPR